MNPIIFNQHIPQLNVNKNRECAISVLGPHGFVLKGMFVGVTQCNPQELSAMAGFIANINIPIHKICIMVNESGRIVPMWINSLLIDDIRDIQFI